ncbi:MAG: FluC/FEX family fluoride channel [Candidatus Limnocylindrus sp.]
MSALMSALLVALGGASGALLRSGVDALTVRLGIATPTGTLALNVVGSFAAGVVATLIADRVLPETARPLLLTGLFGGFTTFSAFALQLARMGEKGELLPLIAYAVGSILIGLLAASAGAALARAL